MLNPTTINAIGIKGGSISKIIPTPFAINHTLAKTIISIATMARTNFKILLANSN